MDKMRSLAYRLISSKYPCLVLDYCASCDRNVIVVIICFVRIFFNIESCIELKIFRVYISSHSLRYHG